MFLKKVLNNLQIIWHSIFYGLSGVNKVINTPGGSIDGIEITQKQIGGGGVFADMLEQKETQQVKETVDASYRIYREAEKYDTSSIRIIGEDENGVIFGEIGRLKKKNKTDFMQHPPVFNPENLKIRTIQDNKHLEDKYNYNPAFLYKYETTLKVLRDNFTPRFEIDKIVKKMVVREYSNNLALVDLYIPSEASQFGKIDAIVISNLHSLKKEKRYKSDLTDFLGFEWFSDKGWNTDDICLFKYEVINLNEINLFDGSFILTYYCRIIEDGKDLTEKYRTKELDEKYLMETPKSDKVDVFTYARKIERDKQKKNNEIDLDNLSTTKIKLE